MEDQCVGDCLRRRNEQNDHIHGNRELKKEHMMMRNSILLTVTLLVIGAPSAFAISSTGTVTVTGSITGSITATFTINAGEVMSTGEKSTDTWLGTLSRLGTPPAGVTFVDQVGAWDADMGLGTFHVTARNLVSSSWQLLANIGFNLPEGTTFIVNGVELTYTPQTCKNSSPYDTDVTAPIVFHISNTAPPQSIFTGISFTFVSN